MRTFPILRHLRSVPPSLLKASPKGEGVHPSQSGTLRSRALGRVGRLAQGVEDLNRSILLHPRATPEFFLERAELQKRMGDITGAVRGLKEGIELLGPIVSLIDTMVKLEVSLAVTIPRCSTSSCCPNSFVDKRRGEPAGPAS